MPGTGIPDIPRSNGASLIHIFTIIGLFFATGDVIFVLSIGGLTVRYTQILLLAAVTLFLTTQAAQRIKLPVGITFLLLIFGLNLAFIPNAPFLSRALAYAFTFFFNVLLVFFYTNYYGISPSRLRSLLHWYIWSYVFVASFGFVQFVGGFFGIRMLASQWLVVGHIIRLTGFSYEPSYFALYIAGGWATLAVLVDSGCTIISRRLQIGALGLLSVVMLLSTSRSGFAAVFGIFAVIVLNWLWRSMRGEAIGRLRKAIAIAGIGIPALTFFYVFTYQYALLQTLTVGLGVMEGNASHSVTDRVAGLDRTMDLAAHHLFFGVSFGGVGPSIATASYPGLTYTEYLDMRTEGLNVFVEAAAAIGIAGLIALILYFAWQFSFLFWRKARNHDLYKVALALGAGLLTQLVLLLAAQNIMRVYVWVHIALLAAVNCALAIEQKGRLMKSQTSSEKFVS